jgi:hypothetical protein
MMEEYDKLGSGDGFTRLRIFLFSQSEQDGSAHFIDGDDPERRYVDALNSLNDASELRRLQQMEFPMIGTIEDIHVADPFINPIAVENGIHSQRSGELGMSQYNLHHIPIPHQQPMGQRYNEIDAQWNPGYYSPRHHGQCHHDSRSSLVDYPSSPSGTRYRVPFPEMPDKGIDRVPDEYARHHVNHHSLYDNQPQYPENVVWLPTGAAHGDKSGFPGNLIHGSHALDGNNICEHCRMGFQRAQPHLEHPNMLPPVAIPCPECPSSRDALAVNADGKLQPTIYPNDTQNHERGCGLQHQGSGRVSDHYVGDVPIINFPHGHGSIIDGHVLPSNHVHQQVGPELGVELFPDQTMAAIPHLKIPPLEECSVQYGKTSSPYGVDNNYAVPCGHAPGYTLWRNGPTPVHIGSPHEAITPPQPVDGVINTGIIRGEGSPGFFVGPDSQSLWVDSSQKYPGHDGSAIPEYPYANASKLNPMTNGQEKQHPIILDAIHPPQEVNAGTCLEPVQLQKTSLNMVHNNEVLKIDTHLTEVISLQSISLLGEGKETKNKDNVENSNVQNLSNAVVASAECKNSFLKPASECGHVEKLDDNDCTAHEDSKHLADQFNILPELIASVKKAALECHDEVKPTCEERVNCQIDNSNTKEETANEVEPVVSI